MMMPRQIVSFALAASMLILLQFSFLVPSAATAAPPDLNSTSLLRKRNLADFDFVIDKVRQNYAGWDTKVSSSTKRKLDSLTAQLRKEAETASDVELTALLSRWISFFEDRHTIVLPLGAGATSSRAGGAAPAPLATPQIPWTEETVRARLGELVDPDPLEGIWSIGENYRVGVLRTSPEKSQFAAVILTTKADNWHVGQVKALVSRGADNVLKILLRMRDHSEVPTDAHLAAEGTVVQSQLGDSWVREFPALPDPGFADRHVPSGKLFIKRISDKTIWLRIPWFTDEYAKPLKDLIAANQSDIDAAPNMIIDIRGNGGGSDYVYGPLIPLIYTRPIVNFGAEVRATDDNIALRHQMAEKLKAEAPEQAARLEQLNGLMRKSLGGYVSGRNFGFTRLESVRPFPRRVVVLIDGAASTAEQFLLTARQSHKVTLMGQTNSAGVVDFANAVSMKTPSGRNVVQWAISRTLRLPDDPVDPYGIPPYVRISQAVADPVTYAARWLERQVD